MAAGNMVQRGQSGNALFQRGQVIGYTPRQFMTIRNHLDPADQLGYGFAAELDFGAVMSLSMLLMASTCGFGQCKSAAQQ